MAKIILISEILLIVGSLLFLVSGITANLHIGNILGAVLCAGLFVALLKRAELAAAVMALWETSAGRTVIIIVSFLGGLCFAAAICISALMIWAMDIPPQKPVNVIVLGCRVKDSGPSLMLEKRIEAAYEYLSCYPEAVCMASGGKGDDEPYSEAKAIADGLIARGIASDRIILEDRSANTFENIRNSRLIMEELGLPCEAVIVTSEFHQLRARLIAKKQGFTVYSKSSQTFLPLLPAYWIREWLGVTHEFLIGRK